MDKSRIPTKEIKVGGDDNPKTVKVYEWLTQSEEDERSAIFMGEQEITVDDDSSTKGKKSAKDNIKLKVDINKVAKARKFLVEHMCVDLKWEEFDLWSPADRSQLLEALESQIDKKK